MALSFLNAVGLSPRHFLLFSRKEDHYDSGESTSG